MDRTELPRLTEPYPVTAAQLEALNAAGRMVLRGVLSPEEIAAYRPAVCDHVARRREAMNEGEREMGASVENISCSLDEAPRAVADFVTAPRFGQLAAQLLGVEAVRLLHYTGFFKPAGGPGTPWHQDLNFLPLDTDRLIVIWVPLVDVSDEMGSLVFAEGSHREGRLAMGPELRRFRMIKNASMRAGDVSIHLGWTLHGSLKNTSNQMREAIAMSYYADGARIAFGSDVAFKSNLLKHYFAGLEQGDLAAGPLNPVVYRRPHA